MANSIVIANVEIQVQDALQSSIPPIVFRTVPPISYPSSFNTQYSGYTQLNAGSSINIIDGLNYPFVYLRNAGNRGVISATVTWVSSPSVESVLALGPGGVFLWVSPITIAAYKNSIDLLQIAPANTDPIVAEWLIAQ